MTSTSFPDLHDVPPPPKVYPRLNGRLRIAMWLAFLGGPCFIANGYYSYTHAAKLRAEGIKTAGTLVDSSREDTGKGRTVFRITLDYAPPPNEMTYRKEFIVPEAIFQQALQAGQYPVTYSPKDPTASMVNDDLSAEVEPIVIGFGLILFSMGVWYYLRRQSLSVDRYLAGETS